MKVKILEVGSKATVDGISSNWVRSLLPVESYKNGEVVSGRVFGEYLTDKLKPFSTAGWANQNLILYLSRFAWIKGGCSYYSYGRDGSFHMGLMESGGGENGTYTVSMKNQTITERAK